jgi:maltooligosyltrehalose trehalohydrolase
MQDIADLSRPLGASLLPSGGCRFRVWAPNVDSIAVRVLAPQEQLAPMKATGSGYYQIELPSCGAGSRYFYRLDGERERPDPASRFQPEGVHGPSQVVVPEFPWEDECWAGLPLQQYIIYELHIGTFTPEGTFESAIQRLDYLMDLGVTAIELMPVAQFPGKRNWGYDGVNAFAVQNSYGGPAGLKRLVNEAHKRGLAVILDVVYNHLGAEGNYLWDYGPYFTANYKTPWGSAVNFDGPGSDEVRRYFIENAWYFLREFHIDALRLDAIHAMLDFSAGTFLEELAAVVDRESISLNRRVYLIAESDLNDSRVVRSPEQFGYGLDAQWSDDFHHSVHTLLTGERAGYYQDFAGPGDTVPLSYLAKALREGYVYSGQYAPSRGRRHGTSSQSIPAHRFVVCIQNHDQVGNRMLGDRLTRLISPARLKLAAALLLLSPYVPLLFMGEEYGEEQPFLYFIDHSDADLIDAVRTGRIEEFSAFQGEGEPADPADPETFRRSALNWGLADRGWHRELRDFYRTLIHLRKSEPALQHADKNHLEVTALERDRVMVLRRWDGLQQGIAIFNLGAQPAGIETPLPAGRWSKVLDTGSEARELASKLESHGEVRLVLPAESCVVYAQREL